MPSTGNVSKVGQLENNLKISHRAQVPASDDTAPALQGPSGRSYFFTNTFIPHIVTLIKNIPIVSPVRQ